MRSQSVTWQRERGTVREDKQRAWKIATAVKEVGEAGYRTEKVVGARKVQPDSFAERISLGGLDGEEHSRRVEMGVDGHIVKRQMCGWVKTGWGRGEVIHAESQPRQYRRQSIIWRGRS